MGSRLFLIAGAALILAAVGAVVWGATNAGQDPVRVHGPTSRASLERGDFSEFSQVNRLGSSLKVTTDRAHGGRHSAEAVYNGGGANGYARGIFNVDWHAGDDVAYSAAFYIPHTTLSALQGQLALMRWDDFPVHPEAAAHGGLVVFGSDRRAHLIREELATGNVESDLVGGFDLPLDRWFTVEVRQRLGGDDARNEVYLDGRLIATSDRENIPPGRDVRRVRYGVAAIASGAQRLPLRVWFDDATATPGIVAGR